MKQICQILLCVVVLVFCEKPGIGNESFQVRRTSPNILFIFSDDHARAALSCYGSVVNQTPHMDRLASRGARFLNSFVTNSICTPSRATLLTGQYSHKNGVPVFNPFDGSKDHLGKRMQDAGYHTGMVGKWHLGTNPTGFDQWIVLPGQGVYFDPQFLTPNGKLTVAGHCTEITTNLGIEFLKSRPKDKPFFLMLHHKAPHRGWEPDEKNKKKFSTQSFPAPSTLFDKYETRPAALPENEQTIARDLTRRDLKLDPPSELSGPALNKWLNEKPMSIEVDGKVMDGKELILWKYKRYMQDYLACVQGVDDSVGAILDYLDENQLRDDTYVIYTADNGWYLGELGLYDKRFMYEPGLRTPLIISGPGIPSASTPSQMVANIDLAPTMLDLADIEVPTSMQGRSLKPILNGQQSEPWRKSIYYRYYHSPGHHNTRAHFGVRTDRHKLIYYWEKGEYEMYDLEMDPDEQRNMLFGAGAENEATKRLFEHMKNELARLQSQYEDHNEYSSPDTWPRGGVDGPFEGFKSNGRKTIQEAMELSKVDHG